MFTSYVGEGDGKIIDFLKQGYNEGKGIKIYGYSRGGNAGIRITNTLGEMGINVFQLVTFDPHSITDGGLELKYNNVAYFYNYFQRNPRTGGPLGWWGKNPYNGSLVKVNPDFNVGGFQTGYSGQHYKDGNFVSHLNIISHAYGK